jgi:hypothetical protein
MTTATNERGRRNDQRPLRAFIVDSAYATIGLGGATAGIVRSIDRLRLEAPRQIRQLVDQGVATSRGLPGLAGREFDDLARRGRELVGAIRTSEATREAVHRTKTARSRVKAAETSIGRAAEGAVEAAEEAATIVAAGAAPSQKREPRTEPPKAPARTRQARPQPRPKPRQAKAKTPPARVNGQGRTGPYEERTVQELQERAAELDVEGRSSMSKDELIKVLRELR